MRTRAQAADWAGLDISYLSTLYNISEDELQTLLDAPTTDLVQTFFHTLTAKGREFDALKADKLKVDVELENAVRSADVKVKAQKGHVTKQAKEIEQLRLKLGEVEAARESLATELGQLRSSASSSSLETEALKQRISSLEASNRDALALIEARSSEKDRLANELAEQHGKLLALRRETKQMESKNQSLEDAVSSQKFKEQSLQQELDLLKRNNEWQSSELQKLSQDQAKFRKERNTRIASLQRELDDTNAAVESLRRTETTLRERLDDLQARVEEAHAKNTALQEEATRKEQDFRTQLEASKRLADLQAQNSATHKARSQDLQGQIERIKDDAAEEIGKLQAEVETERSDKDQAERKVAELELTIERLEQRPQASRPETPMRNGALDPSTPARLSARAASPTALPGSLRKTVGGLSYTQLYADYAEAQEMLENERRRTSKLSTALDELVVELESRSPEILELRSEQDRLEAEVLDFSRLLDESKESRERLVKESEAWQREAEGSTREAEALRQQLRDLSAQIKILLVEIQSRDQGLDEMSPSERLQLERAARGEVDDAALESMTSTGRLIQERLVIFRDVSSLQEQNQRMLRLTQELGDRLEGEEAQAKARQAVDLGREKDQLQQQVERLQDELKATVTQIDSYVKERDMFRRMLQHRGVLSSSADLEALFGQSIPPVTPQRSGADLTQTPRTTEIDDLNKLLKEQQTFFDQFRNESVMDRKLLKEQVDSLAREKSTLHSDIARAQSQLTLAGQRYEMLQVNFAALRKENTELQKRSQQISESAAKQDLRTQQIAEDLIEARSIADSLRNENANVKAERELWKRIEARMTEDLQTVMDERNRLQKLVTDLQSLQNERELADAETRRRLQARTETLESELADAKKKIERETEDVKKMTLRREYEESQSRTRIDDLVKMLGSVREELVATRTTRDQLQLRCDELKLELHAAEEKFNTLQPRLTPRTVIQQNGHATEPGETSHEPPVEQRLALEASELRRDLDLANNELESAKRQIDKYRSIAQSTEEELASINETSEQYKEETERVIAEKDAKIRELQQNITDHVADLNTANTELSELRSESAKHSAALNEQTAKFETEIARLVDKIDQLEEEKTIRLLDLKAQEEIARKATANYDVELQKHAKAITSLGETRNAYNELRTEVAGLRAEAEAAKHRFEQGEESWNEQKERFERELLELRKRKEDMDQQNRLLHEQMEAFSNQLAALRSRGPATAGTEGSERPASLEGNNLQEVIKFLRREKEIVDIQYELSIQESKHLQHRLDYANAQLDETRQKLETERQQAADTVMAESSTSRLAHAINELNVFRESSLSLRNEAKEAREKLEAVSQEVERLVGENEPLKVRIGELEGELEVRQSELKLLQDDRNHWRDRTQNIISKYDRADPAELEELKIQLAAAHADKERLESEQAPMRELIREFDQRLSEEKAQAVKPYEERLSKFRDQAKERDRQQVEKVKQITEQLNATKAEMDKVTDELAQTKTALLTAHSNVEKQAQEEGEVQEDGAPAEQNDEHDLSHVRVAEAEASARRHADRAETLAAEVRRLQEHVQQLEGQVADLQKRLESASSDAQQANKPMPASEDAETLEKLRQELNASQQQVERLRANIENSGDASGPPINAEIAESSASAAGQVAREVAKLRSELEAQHELSKKQMEEDHNQKIERLKANLLRQLREEREKMKEEGRNEVVQQHELEVLQLKEAHDAAVNKLKADHQAELERLSRQGNAAMVKAEVDARPITTKEELLELPEDEFTDVLKNNPRVRTLIASNIKKNVASETDKYTKVIAEKDQEIERLKEDVKNADSNTAPAEVLKKLEAAEADKARAIAQAVDIAEKKAKVQLSQRDMLQARIAVIKRASDETPQKPVREVWDDAMKAKPAPKPAPTHSAAGGSSSTPAGGNSNVPVPPAHAQSLDPSNTQTEQDVEEAKRQARQARFGAELTHTAPSSGGSFGQPGAPAQITPSPFGQSSAPVLPSQMKFGQPSQIGGVVQPARSSGAQPNPQARPFTPTGDSSQQPSQPANTSTQHNQGSGIPRGNSGIPRGGGRGGFSFQGAAEAQQNQQSQRSSGLSSLPRGGGRGGNLGARSGGLNAGQKRQHDGGDSGSEKRMRGGPSGGV